jgi:hypothetical protein
MSFPNNSVAAPEPVKPKPVSIKLRKALLIEKTNHSKGDVVEVDRSRAKKLVNDKAAYRLDASGQVIPEVDQEGNEIPFEDFEDAE